MHNINIVNVVSPFDLPLSILIMQEVEGIII